MFDGSTGFGGQVCHRQPEIGAATQIGLTESLACPTIYKRLNPKRDYSFKEENVSTAIGSRRAGLAGLASVAALTSMVLAGCSTPGSDAPAVTEFGLFINDDNQIVQDLLTSLSEGACAAENEALPLAIQTVPQDGLDQQLQLLASQNAVPALFAPSGTPATTIEYDEAGLTLHLDEALEELGVEDSVAPAAVSTIETLYGGEFIALPLQLNVEGIWYNTQLFEANGLEAPDTWDDLLDAAATLQAAGIQPLAASGEQGWPLTRLIGNYAVRLVGEDALANVASGDAKLTDPEYVEAAQAVADLGANGYFGVGVGSIDYGTAVNQFLTGQAGMLYMGSWVLGDFNNEELNIIGDENIGFAPFPSVEGGPEGKPLVANVGLPIAVSKSAFEGSAEVRDWISCIVTNYGSTGLNEQGAVSGFIANQEITAEVPVLTQLVIDQIASAESSVGWFEALMNAEASSTAPGNVVALVDGQMSAEDYMAAIQADLDAGN